MNATAVQAEATTVRRRTTRPARGLLAGCLLGVLGCGAWALWPLQSPMLPTPPLAAEMAASFESAQLPLDLAAFRAPLWVAPPAPPSAPAPVSATPPLPPPPLRLQLLAIVDKGAGFQAAVYDEAADRLVEVGVGGRVGGATVEEVTEQSVRLLHNGAVHTLTLETAGTPAPGGTR